MISTLGSGEVSSLVGPNCFKNSKEAVVWDWSRRRDSNIDKENTKNTANLKSSNLVED